MKQIPNLTFRDFSDFYCSRQESTYAGLKSVLEVQRERFHPEGWMMLECHQMDSYMCGSLVILPYGGEATFKEIPDHPVSPRGLCSDMSVVIAKMDIEHFDGPEPEPITNLLRKIVESRVNIHYQGRDEESYDRQLAMEAFCREAAEQSQKPVILFTKREGEGQVSPQITFTPYPKKKKSRR